MTPMTTFLLTLQNLMSHNSLEEYFSSKANDIDAILFENLKALEISFYENLLNAIKVFIDTAQKQPVLLFDIDDTIICRDLIDNKDYLRPSFFYLVIKLKKDFPHIWLWILSQRRSGPPSSIRDLFDEKFIICSHWFDQNHLSEPSYAFTDWSERPIYIEKVNAFLDLSSKYTDFSFFLIDDILSHDRKTGSNPLVSKGQGYLVKKDEKFLPEYHIIWIAT